MSATETSTRIVNLADYRAARMAARQPCAPATPYLLWYPGVGYLHQQPSVARLVARGALANEDRMQR